MDIENEPIGQEQNDLAQEFSETVKKLWSLSVRGNKEERNNSKDKSKKWYKLKFIISNILNENII